MKLLLFLPVSPLNPVAPVPPWIPCIPRDQLDRGNRGNRSNLKHNINDNHIQMTEHLRDEIFDIYRGCDLPTGITLKVLVFAHWTYIDQIVSDVCGIIFKT